MRIDLDDTINKPNHIDVFKTKDGYRIHDFVSGMILKVDKFTALLVFMIDGCSYHELKLKLESTLGEDYINEDDIKNVLTNLFNLKFINIMKKKSDHKILLINPCYEFPNETYRKLRITPPLGILSIGSMLHEKGHDVYLLDMLIEDIRPSDLKSYVEAINPDIVGISMNFTSTANVCFNIASELKKLKIETIFVGGNHATFTYEEVLQDNNIDYVIRFQGEETVLEFVEALWDKDEDKLQSCKGIAYRKGGQVIATERRPIPTDMNNLPLPAWHLLPIHKYDKECRWILNTAQGCPCSCTFCSTSAFNNGKKVISMSVDEILKRIRQIIKLRCEDGAPIIGFCDDAFTHDRDRIVELCEQIISEKLKLSWSCSTRVDLIDEELVNLMYRAGCRAMLFGIESCSSKVLKAVGKRIDLEQAKRAIEIAKNRGMKIREMFILGLPFEDYDSLKLIEEFFIETKPHEIRFGLLSVYPGTPLWYHKDKFGINILTTDWSKYDLLKPTSNNTILNEQELYMKYIEFTEKYEQKMSDNELEIM